MDVEPEAAERRCPTCGGSLVCVGSHEIGFTETEFGRRHVYWCPAGCRGPEPDGTLEFIECPACGSDDTFTTPRADGIEELECNACGTITSFQIVQSNRER
jgi:hypothetical protein